MSVGGNCAISPDPEVDQRDDAPFGPEELSALPPLCGEEEWARLTAEMVAEYRPRLFAVFQDCGERFDSRIAAWGLAFDGCAELVDTVTGRHASLPSAEQALALYTRKPLVTARVVWADPGTATSSDETRAA